MTTIGDKGLETLQVWQKSLAFAVEICRNILPMMPVQEKWALTDQLRRSVQSIPANIAEGYGRFYFQETVRFCYTARGSLEETFSHLALAHQLEYINDATFDHLNEQITEIRKMLNGYISFLKESKRGLSEPGSNHFIREESDAYNPDAENPDPLLPDSRSPDP
jgi:four helix bundle protein